MPRKSSPIASVIKFFMTAEIADAKAGVELASSIVKHRESGAVPATPQAVPAAKSHKKKTRGPNKPKAVPAAASTEQQHATQS